MLSLLSRCISCPQGREELFEPRLPQPGRNSLHASLSNNPHQPSPPGDDGNQGTASACRPDTLATSPGITVRTKDPNPNAPTTARNDAALPPRRQQQQDPSRDISQSASCRLPLPPSNSWPVRQPAPDHPLTSAGLGSISNRSRQSPPPLPLPSHLTCIASASVTSHSSEPVTATATQAEACTMPDAVPNPDPDPDLVSSSSHSHTHLNPTLAASRRAHSFSTSNTATASMVTANELSTHPSAGPSTCPSTRFSTNHSAGLPARFSAPPDPHDSAMQQHAHLYRTMPPILTSIPSRTRSEAPAPPADPSRRLRQSISSPRRGHGRRDNNVLRSALLSATREGREHSPGCRPAQHAPGQGPGQRRGGGHARRNPGSCEGAAGYALAAALPACLCMLPKAQQVEEWLYSTVGGDFTPEFTPEFAPELAAEFVEEAVEREQSGRSLKEGENGKELPQQQQVPPAASSALLEEGGQWDLLDPVAWKLNWGLPPPDPDTCHSPFTCRTAESCGDSPQAWQGEGR